MRPRVLVPRFGGLCPPPSVPESDASSWSSDEEEAVSVSAASSAAAALRSAFRFVFYWNSSQGLGSIRVMIGLHIVPSAPTDLVFLLE